MPRKFRLHVRKRQEQRKLVVSIPLSSLSNRSHLFLHSTESRTTDQSELIVSLPLLYFSAVPSSNLFELCSRLNSQHQLPKNWNCSLVGTEQISLYHLSHSAPPRVDLAITIDSSFAWKLYFHSERVEVDSCTPLAAISSLLQSPANILGLLGTLESCHVCIGNPDEKFRALAKHHQGQFMDRSGMYMYMYIHDCSKRLRYTVYTC